MALTGVVLPITCLSGVAITDAYFVHARITKFRNTVHAVCTRALKPTRAKLTTDAEREAFARRMLQNILAKNDFRDPSFDADVNWLKVHVEAASFVEPLTNLVFTEAIPVSTSADCQGIPPYPQDGETLLASTLTDEQGDALYLSKSFKGVENCWDKFDYSEYGWDGATGTDADGNTKTGYIEIQNWNSKKKCFNDAYEIPKEVGSDYVIELDSYYNTSIWKQVELHPGKYRVSLWYFGRTNDITTNGISVSLEGLVGSNMPKTKLLEIARPATDGWSYESVEFTIDEYQIDKLYLSAEGTSDSYGGLINGFKITYLDTLNPLGK